MAVPTASTPNPAGLRELLRARRSGLDEETLAAARALGPEPAGGVAAALLELELTRPTADGTAIRAAHLAGELRLPRAISALVRCLESLDDHHPLHRAALGAVSRLGPLAVEALLAAFDRARSPERRAPIAEALARTGADDERIRAAFVRMLEDDPVSGSMHLAERGEWRALPDLTRAMDRHLHTRVDDCAICSSEHLTAMSSAIRILGGVLTDLQRSAWDEVLAQAAGAWQPFPSDPSELLEMQVPGAQASGKRPPRPSRNAPCPCGSGKKYKKCHLAEDEEKTRH